MADVVSGKYKARQAKTEADVEAAQALRNRCFGLEGRLDQDEIDARCTHILIEDQQTLEPVCCFRFLILDRTNLSDCYAARFYELTALTAYEGSMLELGRFCVSPDQTDPDILRLAWSVLTTIVDENGVKMLFGCSSFAGTETETYLDTFAMLRARHVGPKRWLPRVKAPIVFRFASVLRRKPNLKKAMQRMPPLLRSYLLMGGWVSDHAVIDRQMNTLHVFTGLEVSAIPETRKRLLRALG